MLDVARNLVLCGFAGVVIAICFLSPAGAMMGAINGMVIGLCVWLAERRAAQSLQLAPANHIRLIGNIPSCAQN